MTCSLDASSSIVDSVGDDLLLSYRDTDGPEAVWRANLDTREADHLASMPVGGPAWARIGDVQNAGSFSYFMQLNGSPEFVLWRTNGSSVGTVPVHTLVDYGTVVLGDDLYYVAQGPDGAGELWRADGDTGQSSRVRAVQRNGIGTHRVACSTRQCPILQRQ